MSREFKTHTPASSVRTEADRVALSPESDKKPIKSANGEVGGPTIEPDPTKFGDWSVNGRCVDF